MIAVGEKGRPGKGAYVQAIDCEREALETSNDLLGELKRYLYMPKVRKGDKVGKKVAATAGKSGMTVYGQEIEARDGADFVLQSGNNTLLEPETQMLYALIDGQVSIDPQTIHVYPLYEVNRDLDHKTGDIHFSGNVTIDGNVPSGFEVQSEGDIRVLGTVEGAKLKAGGSIYVGGGIAGQNKSLITAKRHLKTTFINHGLIDVNGNIEVSQAIVQSQCKAKKVICLGGKGLILGGPYRQSSKSSPTILGMTCIQKLDSSLILIKTKQ